MWKSTRGGGGLLGLSNTREIKLSFGTRLGPHKYCVAICYPRHDCIDPASLLPFGYVGLVQPEFVVFGMRFRLSQPCHTRSDEVAVGVGTPSKPLGQETLGNVAGGVDDRCNQLPLRTYAEEVDLDGTLEQTGLDKIFGLVTVFFAGVDHLIGIGAG